MGCPRLVLANLVLCEYPCDKPCPPKLLELSPEVERGLLFQTTGAAQPLEGAAKSVRFAVRQPQYR